MGGPYQILLPLLGLFLVRVDLTDLYPMRLKVDILKVYDGDTVLVKRGSFKYKVRLSRIDAPEKGQPFLSAKQDAGLFSKKCLERNLSSSMELEVYGLDMYGRILGDLNQLSFQLINQGCVTVYPHSRFKSAAEKYQYVRAWMNSKKLKRGVWAFGGFETPKAYRSKHRFSKRRI